MNGLWVPLANSMVQYMSAIGKATTSIRKAAASAQKTCFPVFRALASIRRASVLKKGVAATVPTTLQINNSGVQSMRLFKAMPSPCAQPAIARKNANASGSVSARKKTQPISTTSPVYPC